MKVHCISTEFTMRKHGGEKGVPFRIQIDTFKENESEEYTEHLHSASCQVKVFKVRWIRGMKYWCAALPACVTREMTPTFTSFSLKVLIESRRLTGRRWRRGHHRKRKSTSPPMKPQSWQRLAFTYCSKWWKREDSSKWNIIIQNKGEAKKIICFKEMCVDRFATHFHSYNVWQEKCI